MDIYRYMSFTELYNLIKHNKLKFSKLSLMEDDNEGLAKVFESMLPRSSINTSVSHEDAITYHSKVKDTNYISCWSKEKDSIAMWLLYSKNKDSIRVKTTQNKLQSASNSFCTNNYWTVHLNSPEGTMQTSDSISTVKEVDYKNYLELFDKIKKLNNDFNNEQHKFFDKGLTDIKSSMTEKRQIEFSKIRTKFENESKKIVDNALFIKDNAYKHELEIRSLIRVNRRNNVTEEEYLNADRNSMPLIFGLLTYGEVPLNTFDKIIEIPIDDNFIEEICFDPRMPDFQMKVYKEILNLDNNMIVKTNVFGLFSKDIDLSIEFDFC